MPTGEYKRKPIIPWTKEEYLIVWKNMGLPNKEVRDLLPGRSRKSVENHLLSFRRLEKEDIDFLNDNREEMTVKEMDTERNLVQGTSMRFFKMKGLRYIHSPRAYRKHEIDTLKKYAGLKKYSEIANILGVSESRVRNMASAEGIETKYRYTLEVQKDILNKIDDGYSVKEAADSIGKTEDSVKVMLRKNGYHKYLDKSIHSVYHTTKPEKIIMEALEEEFGLKFPEKSPENREFYFGIIPPYEVDIPFEIDGHLFAIEYDGVFWHKDRKELDKKKEELLIKKGYNFFRLSSWMHHWSYDDTFDPVINVLIQSIKNIIRN